MKPVLEVSEFFWKGKPLCSSCISVSFSALIEPLEEKEKEGVCLAANVGCGKESPGLCLNKKK